jgi:hypothetical protein
MGKHLEYFMLKIRIYITKSVFNLKNPIISFKSDDKFSSEVAFWLRLSAAVAVCCVIWLKLASALFTSSAPIFCSLLELKSHPLFELFSQIS